MFSKYIHLFRNKTFYGTKIKTRAILLRNNSFDTKIKLAEKYIFLSPKIIFLPNKNLNPNNNFVQKLLSWG